MSRRELVFLLLFIVSGAVTGLAFHGYWITAWIGLGLFVWTTLTAERTFTIVVGSYLGGLLFNIVAIDWVLHIVRNGQPLVLFHWLAISWPISALFLQRLRMSACVALPVAWTIGTATPIWIAVAIFGPPGHFHMNRLAQTQLDLPVVQIADIAGMTGVEFIMAATAGAVVDLIRRPAKQLVFVAMLLAGAWGYGQVRLSQAPGERRIVALHSGRFPRLDSPGEYPKADLFVWPEIACPMTWPESEWREFATRLGGTVVAGVQRVEGLCVYNSVIVAASNKIGYANKRFLVMGAESPSPVAWAFDISHRHGLFATGDTASTFTCNGLSLVVPICYEITVPGAIVGRPEMIVNPGSERKITNVNGTIAMLNQARLRAIESRRPVVRAIVAGYTAIIDGNGSVLASAVNEPLVGEVPLDSRSSLYTVAGDWLAVVSCAIVGAVLLRRSLNSKNRGLKR